MLCEFFWWALFLIFGLPRGGCFISSCLRGGPVMLMMAKGSQSHMLSRMIFCLLVSRWTPIQTLLPCYIFNPRHAYLAEHDFFLVKCVAFPVKYVAWFISLVTLSFVPLREVTLGASCWFSIYRIAPVSTLDPLCSVLICYLPHNLPQYLGLQQI